MMGPGTRVHLCGPMRIELDGKRIEQALPGRQGRLLFAYLLLERRRGASREELMTLLWPDRQPPSAGVTLRALLSKLRGTLGRDVLLGTADLRIDLGDEPWIDVEAAASSVDDADHAIAEGALREAWSAAQVALSITSKRFLPGDEGDWTEEKRREVEDLRLLALERVAAAALELGGSELVSAERAARAIMDAAPYRESGYLLLMQVLAARGNPAEAVRVYDRARTLLRDELGIAPARELRALHEELLGSDLDAAAATPAPMEQALPELPPLLAGVERTPLIGRTHELSRLVACFEGALASSPGAVAVTGEAGIGKTRLIGELARTVHQRNGLVLYGAAPREPSPYHAFLDALRQFIDEMPEGQLARLRSIDPAVLARLLPELHEATGPPSPAPMVDEQAGRTRALVAVTRAIGAIASQGPLLLALDDMHWADAATLQLLAHLLCTARQAPLLVLVAYRTEEALPALIEALEQAQRRAPIERVALPPLSQRDVDALISAWAGTGAPASFARNLYERTDGNPFFIGHMLRHLIRAGAIDPDERRWASAADIWSLGVPNEVRELIDLRLAAFDKPARLVLNTAAAVGHQFTLELVECAIGTKGDVALDALEDALRAGLIVEDRDQASGFRFVHALVREAIYGQLSAPRRGRLHRAVAEAIQSLHAADLEPHRTELARHFVAAARAGEDPDPAIRNSLAAAQYARRLFANEQAEAHYHAALELLQLRPDSGLKTEACEGLGDMMTVRASYSQAEDAYLDALADIPAEHRVDRARLERKLGVAYMRARRDYDAIQAFERAERELQHERESEEAVGELIDVALDRLTLFYWQDDTDSMGRVIEQISPLVDRRSAAAQRVRLLNSMLVHEMRRRRFHLTPKSVELARQALAASEATGDTVALTFAEFLLGFAHLWSDAPDRAIEHLERAIEHSAIAGHVMYQARSMAYLSVAHRRRRTPSAAEPAARRALDASIAANMPEFEALARTTLAWVAAINGHTADAREQANSALEVMKSFPYSIPMFLGLALWPLIAVELSEHDIRAATLHATRLLEPRQRPLSPSVQKLVKSAVEHCAGDPPTAARQLIRALELADGITLRNAALSQAPAA